MTPFRSNQRGTLILDLRVRHLGRIARASGTDDAQLVEDMKAAFRLLAKREGGRALLKAMFDKKLTPMELYERFVRGQPQELPDPDSLVPLARLTDWAKTAKTGEDNRAARILAARRLLEHAPKAARISALPAALQSYRDACIKEGTPTAFRLAREVASAFARDTFGRHQALWNAIRSVEPLRRPKPKRRPMSVGQFLEAVGKLDPACAEIAWAMAVTGMGKRELWETPWEERVDRVLIGGTKRPGRSWGGEARAVPWIRPLTGPTLLYPAFRRSWIAAADGRGTRDLRRTYARWLQEAKVPRTRRRLYYGHGAVDVSDLYEEYEITEFLREDGRRLRKLLGLEAAQRGRKRA